MKCLPLITSGVACGQAKKKRKRSFFALPVSTLTSMLEHLFCVKKKIQRENKMQEALE
jgi:hypothetical protein